MSAPEPQSQSTPRWWVKTLLSGTVWIVSTFVGFILGLHTIDHQSDNDRVTNAIQSQTDASNAAVQAVRNDRATRREAIRISEAQVYATYLGHLGSSNELLWTYVWTHLPAEGEQKDHMWAKLQAAQGELTASYSNALLVTKPGDQSLLRNVNRAQHHQFHTFRCALKPPPGSAKRCTTAELVVSPEGLREELDPVTDALDTAKRLFTESAAVTLNGDAP